MKFDSAKFNMLIVTGQTVEPDFSNAEFLSKAKCVSASEFIEKKLLPGEISTIANKVLELSGFDLNMNEEIEEAKN